jgi:hypothetical protein
MTKTATAKRRNGDGPTALSSAEDVGFWMCAKLTHGDVEFHPSTILGKQMYLLVTINNCVTHEVAIIRSHHHR